MKVTMMNQNTKVKCRLRFDVQGAVQSPKLFFKSTDSQALAKENRLKEVNILKNMPPQGIVYEKISSDGEIYILEEDNIQMAYAPIEVILKADFLEDLLPLILKDSFRRVEIIEPSDLSLDKYQGERLLLRMVKEYNEKLEELMK